MHSSTLNIKFRNHNMPLVAVTLLLPLAVCKDLLHSYIKNYHFYLSESALFETFWLIFIPILFRARPFQKNKGKIKTFPLVILLSLIHIAIFSAWVFAFSAVFFNHTFGFSSLFIKTGLQNGMACLLVYGIAGVASWQGKLLPETGAQIKRSQKIAVRYQNRTVLIDIDNIIYIKSESPYIAFVTREKTFLHSSTLKAFMKEKATHNFIRIHKSTIVNTSFIKSYISRKNGDYDLTLTNQQTLRASRHYSQLFKSRL